MARRRIRRQPLHIRAGMLTFVVESVGDGVAVIKTIEATEVGARVTSGACFVLVGGIVDNKSDCAYDGAIGRATIIARKRAR